MQLKILFKINSSERKDIYSKMIKKEKDRELSHLRS